MRFLDLCRERESIVRELAAILPACAISEAEELLDSLLLLSEEGHEVAVAAACECLLIRIYDEGYAFPYPYPLFFS